MLEVVSSVLTPFCGWISLLFFITALIYWLGVSEFALISHVPLPGPKPWPYVGNLIEVARYGGLHKAFVEYAKKYGKVYKMYMGRSPMITVADPEMLKHILVKDFEKFRNRPDFMRSNPPLESNLFAARDEQWKKVRSLLTPTFSSSKLREILPIIEDAANVLVGKLEKSADSEQSIDVLSPIRLFSLDIILRAGFGLDAQVQTDPDPEMVEKALTVLETPVYVRAMSMFPFYKQVKEFFDVDLSQHSSYFIALSKSIFEKRKTSSGRRRDLFQLMLEAREENAKGTQRLTDEEIVAQSVLFVIAGSETTGTTMAFFAFYLAHHPDVQEKLLCEIDHATRSRGDAPIGEFVQSLQYLDRVVSEGLRHSSVGFGDVRQCMETCVINGVEFPEGVSVNIPAYAIHRDPDFWPEPEKFDPDRFLPEEVEKRPSFCYLPFGLGPKQCIGIRMALLELKIGLVKILQRVKFERGVGTTEKLELQSGIILTFLKPMCVKLVKRSRDDSELGI